MFGELFLYQGGRCAFQSGDINSPNFVLLIGGLGDGLLSIPYTEHLSHYLGAHKICLVQMIMKSSYSGYGFCSLEDDMHDIIALVKYLRDEKGKLKVVFLGHSTGCQDIMWLCSKWFHHGSALAGVVVGGILQAPVSDREADEASIGPDCPTDVLEWARSRQNKNDICQVTRMSAYRILSLYERLGDDDFFSTDLSVPERQSKLASVPFPLMVIFSSNDEYFPYKKKLDQLLSSMQYTWPQITKSLVLDNADHGVTDPKHQQLMSAEIVMFASGLF